MLGGAIGSAARYHLGRLMLGWFGPGYPWGTLAANLVGGLLMGALAGVLARSNATAEPWRLLLGVGLLGGFTTFSAFTLETANMIIRGQTGGAIGYALLSVAGALMALFVGLQVTRALP
ncbi:hypothetical protein NX02_26470 [Sphingomonas sanxanigenens DSM 19645 = NX02]|uniref:Fluoride-specific ion channel FluC n=2 Tax=Sphingomonas sanxanigenens TaxID=397260 RepID=W0AKR0_9SPHN|nr:hypothetical protein NX02_26470 [Sphingomonas sanxanigenens DSM 19645 = NX02]